MLKISFFSGSSLFPVRWFPNWETKKRAVMQLKKVNGKYTQSVLLFLSAYNTLRNASPNKKLFLDLIGKGTALSASFLMKDFSCDDEWAKTKSALVFLLRKEVRRFPKSEKELLNQKIDEELYSYTMRTIRSLVDEYNSK